MPISRRDLLKAVVAAGGLAALGNEAKAVEHLLAAPTHGLPLPANSPINTIVVLMMENRSWDHFFSWIKGTSDAEHPVAYYDSNGVPHYTQHWGEGGMNDYKGCGYSDPGHGWSAGRVQFNDGAIDGFAKQGSGNDDYALGYYRPKDIPVWSAIAEQTTMFKHYYCSVLGPTYPNRWYMHAATSGGRKSNDFAPNPIEGWPEKTIWDACNEAGVSWAYYYSNLPVIGLYGERMMVRNGAHIRHISSYYADAAAGVLPQVCFVDPFFVADQGLANDDHPHADIRLGQQLIADVVSSFVDGPQWTQGALFINYDEWGGFFDTSVPPTAADDLAAQGFDQLGFRTPAAVISPFATGGLAPHTYDHTSILKFIEWRYGLPSLTARDAAARNIGEVLDLSLDPTKVDKPEIPNYTAPADARIPCEAHEVPVSDLLTARDAGVFDAIGLRTDYRFADSFRSF